MLCAANQQHSAFLLNLNDFLQQEELIALNDGEPTFTCTNEKSVIDLVLCNANQHRFFCGLAIDYYTEMYTGAPNRGHYPVIATFGIAGNSRFTHVKDLKKTDWKKWRETLENCVQSRWPEIDECYDATSLWGILLQCISEAANPTIPLKQITSHSKPYFNEELKMLSLQLRKARKKMKLRSDSIITFNYETLKRQFQTTLMKSKAEHYKTCAETLNASKGSDFWKAKNLFTRTRETIPMGCLISNGKVLDSDADKFEHLRSTFFSDSHLHGNMFDESWLRNVGDKLTANLHPDYLQPPSIQIREEELDKALKESQTSKKSSDPDGIHPLMLRHTELSSKLPASSFLTSAYMQAPTFEI